MGVHIWPCAISEATLDMWSVLAQKVLTVAGVAGFFNQLEIQGRAAGQAPEVLPQKIGWQKISQINVSK
jgi:hypothetical protein